MRFPLCSSKTCFVESGAFNKFFNDPGSSFLVAEGVVHKSVGPSGERTS